MIDLYTWTTPNGRKASIALEEFGLPYTAHAVDIGKDEQYKPEFLKISPNNRMPAIVDHDDPANSGSPVPVFESGAILLHLAERSGRFMPAGRLARKEVMEWLFWQVGNLGPMAGQAHHFRMYAPEKIAYAINRYTNECNRLYGVMNKRLAGHAYLAGQEYTIADMAVVGWTSRWERQGQDPNEFPQVKRWLETVTARPAVKKGLALAVEDAKKVDMQDPKVWNLLFNQRAR